MEMTKQEFLDKYGERLVEFASYWKYTFTYEGEGITVDCGGDADEIYRDSHSTGECTINSLQPYAGTCGKDSFYDI